MKVQVKIHGLESEYIELSTLISSIQVISGSRIVLPLTVLNDFFGKPYDEYSVNTEYEWQPFTIDELEYNELVTDLKKVGFKEVEVPTDVNDYYSWIAWGFEYRFGVPRKEHLSLLLEEKEVMCKVKAAEDKGDDALVEALFVEEFEITNKIQDFMEPYLDTEE